jgi:SAM-dependent methyltransferase
MAEFAWPLLPSGEAPVWTGTHFEVAGRQVPFLRYSENLAGWDDGLTSLHRRESAGLHPIDITSRYNAIKGLREALGRSPARVLEVGSSDGHFLKDLKAAFADALVVGSEVAPGALAHIAEEQPGMPLVQIDILDCPLPGGTFDAVVALNVLEHIEDDRSAIMQMARLLRPGGVLLVEVPSGPFLYEAYDRELRHFRRYRMSDLVNKIQGAGLELISKGHVGFLIYPAFAAVKLANRLRGRALEGREVVAQSIRQSRRNPIVAALFSIERSLSGRFSWPIGIRCLVVARKV